MTNTVKCHRLGIEAEALEQPPYPGELGRKIQANISKQAWKQWLSHQTMLINEYRLSLIEPSSRKFLEQEMDKFLFSGESLKPPAHIEVA